MAEYIDRKDAIEAVKHAWAKGLDPTQYIEIIPAADVAPVRHGEWIEDCLFIQCSACGYDFDPMEESTPYCPNCGAKMDGGAE